MKRGHKIAIAATTLAFILVGVLALALRPARIKEPLYRGRKLSHWIERYENMEELGLPPQQAIQEIGTNALPTLLHWISYNPPRWRLSLAEWFGAHDMRRLCDLALGPRARKTSLAVAAFHPLGTNAYRRRHISASNPI